jgi:hypothetical protein
MEDKENAKEEEEVKVRPKFKKGRKKSKKTGSNFYETHNAKNRPRKREQGNDSSDHDDNGAKKKKKKNKKR